MLNVTELRNGVVFKEDNNLFQVLNYEHIKMGRGSGNVKVKVRNLRSGAVVERSFITGARVQDTSVDKRQTQYLYNDGNTYYFMDKESYEQFELPASIIGGQSGFMKEGDKVQAQLFEGRVINIELPKNVPLKVTYTENAVKGDTSSSITKDADLETGIKIKVPAFIKTGDLISVDTSTGTYRERVKD